MSLKRTAGRSTLIISILVGLILVSIAMADRPGQGGMRRAKTSVVAMLSSANALDLHQSLHATVPGPTSGLVPLRSLKGSIRFDTPRYFADHDSWGQELLYWSNGYDYMIVSYGSDRQPEFSYDDSVPYARVPAGTLTEDPRQDIVVVNGQVRYGPVFKNFGRSTMGSMRSLSTAVLTYSIDNNDYPSSGDIVVEASTIKPLLSPTYIFNFPEEDEWGNPLLFWSNRVRFAVISTGADGMPDEPYSTWQTIDFNSYEGELTLAPARDIVLIDGEFRRRPKSSMP